MSSVGDLDLESDVNLSDDEFAIEDVEGFLDALDDGVNALGSGGAAAGAAGAPAKVGGGGTAGQDEEHHKQQQEKEGDGHPAAGPGAVVLLGPESDTAVLSAGEAVLQVAAWLSRTPASAAKPSPARAVLSEYIDEDEVLEDLDDYITGLEDRTKALADEARGRTEAGTDGPDGVAGDGGGGGVGAPARAVRGDAGGSASHGTAVAAPKVPQISDFMRERLRAKIRSTREKLRAAKESRGGRGLVETLRIEDPERARDAIASGSPGSSRRSLSRFPRSLSFANVVHPDHRRGSGASAGSSDGSGASPRSRRGGVRRMHSLASNLAGAGIATSLDHTRALGNQGGSGATPSPQQPEGDGGSRSSGSRSSGSNGSGSQSYASIMTDSEGSDAEGSVGEGGAARESGGDGAAGKGGVVPSPSKKEVHFDGGGEDGSSAEHVPTQDGDKGRAGSDQGAVQHRSRARDGPDVEAVMILEVPRPHGTHTHLILVTADDARRMRDDGEIATLYSASSGEPPHNHRVQLLWNATKKAFTSLSIVPNHGHKVTAGPSIDKVPPATLRAAKEDWTKRQEEDRGGEPAGPSSAGGEGDNRAKPPDRKPVEHPTKTSLAAGAEESKKPEREVGSGGGSGESEASKHAAPAPSKEAPIESGDPAKKPPLPRTKAQGGAKTQASSSDTIRMMMERSANIDDSWGTFGSHAPPKPKPAPQEEHGRRRRPDSSGARRGKGQGPPDAAPAWDWKARLPPPKPAVPRLGKRRPASAGPRTGSGRGAGAPGAKGGSKHARPDPVADDPVLATVADRDDGADAALAAVVPLSFASDIVPDILIMTPEPAGSPRETHPRASSRSPLPARSVKGKKKKNKKKKKNTPARDGGGRPGSLSRERPRSSRLATVGSSRSSPHSSASSSFSSSTSSPRAPTQRRPQSAVPGRGGRRQDIHGSGGYLGAGSRTGHHRGDRSPDGHRSMRPRSAPTRREGYPPRSPPRSPGARDTVVRRLAPPSPTAAADGAHRRGAAAARRPSSNRSSSAASAGSRPGSAASRTWRRGDSGVVAVGGPRPSYAGIPGDPTAAAVPVYLLASRGAHPGIRVFLRLSGTRREIAEEIADAFEFHAATPLAGSPTGLVDDETGKVARLRGAGALLARISPDRAYAVRVQKQKPRERGARAAGALTAPRPLCLASFAGLDREAARAYTLRRAAHLAEQKGREAAWAIAQRERRHHARMSAAGNEVDPPSHTILISHSGSHATPPRSVLGGGGSSEARHPLPPRPRRPAARPVSSSAHDDIVHGPARPTTPRRRPESGASRRAGDDSIPASASGAGRQVSRGGTRGKGAKEAKKRAALAERSRLRHAREMERRRRLAFISDGIRPPDPPRSSVAPPGSPADEAHPPPIKPVRQQGPSGASPRTAKILTASERTM